jgi:thymidylate synthase
MEQYHEAVKQVLSSGQYKQNRTGVDTLSKFSVNYTVDLQKGFPLLTTKSMDGFRWNSLLHEICWYFSGQHHIRDLSDNTSIWDAWADENKNLPTAYGRFWRRFPIPSDTQKLPGEWWIDQEDWYSDAEDWYGEKPEKSDFAPWINEEDDGKTFDQLRYVIDTINGDHPHRDKNSRRLVVTAWHPANASVSKLPPCHFTFVLNVQGNQLNTHLTQRSGDIALGVPFNIASYAVLTKVIAQRTGLKPGKFSHTIVDSHIYCGKSERGAWYNENIQEVRNRVLSASQRQDFKDIASWIKSNAPDQSGNYDHVPGLLKQISREPLDRPSLEIENKKLRDLERSDFELNQYSSHEGIKFDVAE